MKIDLKQIQQSLSDIGMVAVPRNMSLKEFCFVSGISESEVRHHPEKFEHLRVSLPIRKNVYNSAAVLSGISRGSLKS
jgi:hypothetical protein